MQHIIFKVNWIFKSIHYLCECCHSRILNISNILNWNAIKLLWSKISKRCNVYCPTFLFSKSTEAKLSVNLLTKLSTVISHLTSVIRSRRSELFEKRLKSNLLVPEFTCHLAKPQITIPNPVFYLWMHFK